MTNERWRYWIERFRDSRHDMREMRRLRDYWSLEVNADRRYPNFAAVERSGAESDDQNGGME